MGGALNNVVGYSVSALSGAREEIKEGKLLEALESLVVVLLAFVLNALFGQMLWNGYVKRLVPGLGVARWYDTIALQVLLHALMSGL
tara:strand:+ start:218 stop:478 length:261 start_codon:yes stop_codon:yes gene_type:complete